MRAFHVDDRLGWVGVVDEPTCCAALLFFVPIGRHFEFATMMCEDACLVSCTGLTHEGGGQLEM